MCFEPGILQSKVAFPPIGIETLAIGEIGSASVFRRNTKLVRIQEVIYVVLNLKRGKKLTTVIDMFQ